MSRIKISLEELDPENTEVVSELDNIDLQEEIQEDVTIDNKQEEIVDASEELDQAGMDVDSLTSIANNLDKIEKPSEEVIAIANEAIASLYRRLGIKSETKLGLEGFKDSNNKKVFLNVAVETIGEKIKTAIKAVINFFKDIWARVVEFFKILFDKTERLKKKTKDFKSGLKKLKEVAKNQTLHAKELNVFRNSLAVSDSHFVMAGLPDSINSLTKTLKEYTAFNDSLCKSIQNIPGLEAAITDKNLYDSICEKPLFKDTSGWVPAGIAPRNYPFDFSDIVKNGSDLDLDFTYNIFMYNNYIIGRKAILGRLPAGILNRNQLINKINFSAWRKSKIGVIQLHFNVPILNDGVTLKTTDLDKILDCNLNLLNQVSDSKKTLSELERLNKETVKQLEKIYRLYSFDYKSEIAGRSSDILGFVRNIPSITSYPVMGLIKHSLSTATSVLQFVKLNASKYEYEKVTDSVVKQKPVFGAPLLAN